MSLVRFRLWAFFLRIVRMKLLKYGALAQSVEQRTENPRVAGSIPALGICIYKYVNMDGILAQLVEHLTFNQVVRGSNPRCFTA